MNTHHHSITSLHFPGHGRCLNGLLGTLLALAFSTCMAWAGSIPFTSVVNGKAYGVPASVTNPYLYDGYVAASGGSSLGDLRVVAHHRTHADTGAIVSGLVVFQTPHGLLYGIYTGQEAPTSDPSEFNVMAEVIFQGGTGQYRRATGSARISGTLTIVSISAAGIFDENVSLILNGTLILPGRP